MLYGLLVDSALNPLRIGVKDNFQIKRKCKVNRYRVGQKIIQKYPQQSYSRFNSKLVTEQPKNLDRNILKIIIIWIDIGSISKGPLAFKKRFFEK